MNDWRKNQYSIPNGMTEDWRHAEYPPATPPDLALAFPAAPGPETAKVARQDDPHFYPVAAAIGYLFFLFFGAYLLYKVSSFLFG